MANKRKHNKANVLEPTKKDSDAPERPKQTLLKWKDPAPADTKESSPIFRNKEKVFDHLLPPHKLQVLTISSTLSLSPYLHSFKWTVVDLL